MIRYNLGPIIAGWFLALIAMQAGAATCANGVYNAGCVNRNGAIAVQKSDPPVSDPPVHARPKYGDTPSTVPGVNSVCSAGCWNRMAH